MPDLTVWPTDGADGSVSSEARWRKMARPWVPSGVDASLLGLGAGNGLAPTLVAGPTINVTAGACWLDGHYAELTTPASIPATANGLLVVRFTPADNHAELLYRDAATTCTQTLATWELPVAQMVAGALKDIRWFTNLRGELGYVGTTTSVAVPASATPAAPVDVDTLPAVYCDGSGLEFQFAGNASGPNPVGGLLYVRLWVDAVDAGILIATYVNLSATLYGRLRYTPTAGVHLFRSRAYLAGAANPGSLTIWHTLAVTRV